MVGDEPTLGLVSFRHLIGTDLGQAGRSARRDASRLESAAEPD